MSARLTEPQQALLDEIRESSTGGLWIRGSSRYGRTVQVLLRLGLVRYADRAGGQTFYVPTSRGSE